MTLPTQKLITDHDREWDTNEKPQVYFNRTKKAMKQLKRAGIQFNLNEQRDMALYFLNASEEYDATVGEWEVKPTVDKTWSKIKVFIPTKYVKKNQFKTTQSKSDQRASQSI